MGLEYAQNTLILFRAEIIPRKHHFWSFFGYNNSSVSNPTDFNTRTFSKCALWDWNMRKTH